MFKSFIFIFCVFSSIYSKLTYNTYRPVDVHRSTMYAPIVISKTCLLKPQQGPCRGNIKMHYFEPKIMNCSTFRWGGCQGNGNRFNTKSECIETCISKPNPQKVRPKWCNLRFDYGFCFGADTRWYYDSLWKVCKETIYSGCGGNKNNFQDRYECESFCLFGVPRLRASTPYVKLEKRLVINPKSASTKKSAYQGVYYNETPATATVIDGKKYYFASYTERGPGYFKNISYVGVDKNPSVKIQHKEEKNF